MNLRVNFGLCILIIFKIGKDHWSKTVMWQPCVFIAESVDMKNKSIPRSEIHGLRDKMVFFLNPNTNGPFCFFKVYLLNKYLRLLAGHIVDFSTTVAYHTDIIINSWLVNALLTRKCWYLKLPMKLKFIQHRYFCTSSVQARQTTRTKFELL